MNVTVTVRGDVAEEVVERVRAEVAALEAHAGEPVLGARVVLTQEKNPRLERPARAEAELSLNGRAIRGRTFARTMSEAADGLAEHLRRRLHSTADTMVSAQQRPAVAPAGEWRRGAWDTRPSGPARPAPDERGLIRRRMFATEPITPIQARAMMRELERDFLLFEDSTTGKPAVIARREEGAIARVDPVSEPMSVGGARAALDASGEPLLFFFEAGSGRAMVLYRRQDGDDGLVEPAPA
jgi:ribosome-associated translation inhibitor RaiA